MFGLPTSATIAPPRPTLLIDQACLDAALANLARIDAAFVAEVLGERGGPALRRRDPGFEGLAWIIVGQQVSVASATAIFGRLKAGLGTLDASTVLATTDMDLRALGLSAPKQRTLRAIAEAIASGALDLAALGRSEAETAHATLRAIKGIGPWTADIFLLFCLGHADAWPAGDLALQEAARMALDLPARPSTKELIAIGERWRPHRGVAAHCLWAYYNARKQDGPASMAIAALPTKTFATKTSATKTPATKIPATKIPATKKRTA